MYGSGLRVKDLDFGQGTITVHDGKGGKHHVVTLPLALEQRLKDHLAQAREKHLQDIAVGAGDVHVPEALMRKYPFRNTAFPAWQFLHGPLKSQQ
jgi:integrase